MQGLRAPVADWHDGSRSRESVIADRRGAAVSLRGAPSIARSCRLASAAVAARARRARRRASTSLALIGFARDLASMGHTVVTADLPDLARYASPRASPT